MQKFNKNGDFITKFGSYGTSGGEGLSLPFYMDVDKNGNAYVGNMNNVVSFNYQGGSDLVSV